jgi:hypothetical protein
MIAPVIEVIPDAQTNIVKVVCPYCGKKHSHGVVKLLDTNRSAHCGRGEYFIRFNLYPRNGQENRQ